MKKLLLLTSLLVIIPASPAIAQLVPYVPCLVDAQQYNPVAVTSFPPIQRPQPIWRSPRWSSTVYKIKPSNSWMIPIVMPVAGVCKGSFESYDDRDDLAVVITDNLGRWIRKPPPGDIEIMIMNEFAYAERLRGRSYSAIYSSGRQFSGDFAVTLPAGYFNLVISNAHSYLAPKSVTFTLGEGVTP